MKIQKLERCGSHCKQYETPAEKKAMKKQTSKARRTYFKIHGENSTGKLKELTRGWLF
jgi:hypothetical protein